MKGENLYLNPNECKFISLAVASVLEQITEASKDVRMNFNPQARKYLKDMVEAGNGVKVKLEKLGLDVSPLDPYNEGDENEFLTKQS